MNNEWTFLQTWFWLIGMLFHCVGGFFALLWLSDKLLGRLLNYFRAWESLWSYVRNRKEFQAWQAAKRNPSNPKKK